MVQVRCADCGYLQSLSDERFLNISEDFLNCPHCHARIPKTWTPAQVDSIPEDVRHKMLAFSSRILNGGDITKEVVNALESLFRKYGPLENTVRALGLGYASVGESKKAEEFLIQVHDLDSTDKEVCQSLLKIYLSLSKYQEAVGIGMSLVQASEAEDDDIGRLGLALIRTGRQEEAGRLLESRPCMDNRNLEIRKAKKELHAGSPIGIGAIFSGKVPFNKLFSISGKESLKAISSRARSLVSSPGAQLLGSLRRTGDEQTIAGIDAGGATTLESALWTNHCEYWVYTPTSTIPSWEDLKRSFLQQPANRQNRSRELQNLENLIAKQKLTIDYILREEAGDLFEYPVELLEFNSRELEASDFKTFRHSQMIIRIRFSDSADAALENVTFLTRFVEAVRNVSGGVIQDAVSHVLWGQRAWERSLYDERSQVVQSNVLIDLLDEDGALWAHSHGMRKFGLPDIELEGVPKEFGVAAAKLIMRACESLAELRSKSSIISQPLRLTESPVLCGFEYRKPDAEGHFPAGSFLLSPYTSDDSLTSETSLSDALKVFSRVSGPARVPVEKMALKSDAPAAKTDIISPDLIVLRKRILDAHRQARGALDIFRKSFQESNLTENRVHAVKVGFPAHGGQYEWMWVSLNAWRGKSLVGFLENAPVLRKDLQKGAKVRINEAEIFDWVIANGNSILDGGFTEQVVHDN